ncbi:Dihydrodipicolinate reductase [Alkaliphilus metalliredigens QYMF]|uniref:4-hydroxy-tetrahydrodipicolinate reductase n=1 Tax=Alkaliphilus metalliredigens (strain QYMF) TaxID=293826 RepID=DAPB_ALKMQ|nr:4-hydroxy-tetrahydrodipicolinate reductase [Alkaliphilus metalliredigens]A6TT16.1 RecName: Full=4-hydroxy-tetrahydrodipicolinate reductase; Short=HTPA reductase [Alkaliphilus metalliredigens QYMF]ABR49334.1 Dihydrodipicolinate reductase [Alkaliphilus metalliredigens QYMF]
MKLLIWGLSGTMGNLISVAAQKDSHWSNIAGVDAKNPTSNLKHTPEVIIDFSHPSALEGVLDYAMAHGVPLVIGTTGFEKEHLEAIDQAAKHIPVLQATNMSLGMNILFSLVEQVAGMLKNKADIEVIESHHNRKMDAPSGSAVTIVECIEKGLGEARKHQHGREGQCPREKGEIGVHAIRGGNIVGFHEANFINELETVKVSHEAHDRSVFAQGALEAAKFVVNQPTGLYHMKDVLGLT